MMHRSDESAEQRADEYKEDAKRALNSFESLMEASFNECVGEVMELESEVEGLREDVDSLELEVEAVKKRNPYANTILQSLERVQALITKEIKMLKAVYEIKDTDLDVGDGAKSDAPADNGGLPPSS